VKDLLLLRHAKSDWDSGVTTDFERPLNARGQKSATLIGRWLAGNAPHPDRIVSSPSERTRQTLLRVCPLLGFAPEEIVWDSRVYEASLSDLLDVVIELPAGHNCVMVVGHNPGLEELLTYLTADPINRARSDKIFPTAAVAHFRLATGWQTLKRGSGNLVKLVTPRSLSES
jgi:phosphohistidine phosphatase